MMKKLIIILLATMSCGVACAQEVRGQTAIIDSTGTETAAPGQSIIGGSDAPTHIYTYGEYRGEPMSSTDSLHLPVLDSFGRTYINMYPYSWYGLYDWKLHKGLNFNLGASVFASFGDWAFSGVGFTQSMAAMYPYR